MTIRPWYVPEEAPPWMPEPGSIRDLPGQVELPCMPEWRAAELAKEEAEQEARLRAEIQARLDRQEQHELFGIEVDEW